MESIHPCILKMLHIISLFWRKLSKGKPFNFFNELVENFALPEVSP